MLLPIYFKANESTLISNFRLISNNRQNCGLIGMEWAAIPSLKLRTKTLLG